MKYLANLLTSLRIILSLTILFVKPFSILFYILYILSGITDISDGFIARKTNTESRFGANFDSIAYAIFVAVCLIKILPILQVKIWIFIWITMIVFIKVINIISGYVFHGCFFVIHTVSNKITGLLIFILPLTINNFNANHLFILGCSVATFAAIHEGHIIRRNL